MKRPPSAIARGARGIWYDEYSTPGARRYVKRWRRRAVRRHATHVVKEQT